MNSQEETNRHFLQKLTGLLPNRAQCYATGVQTTALCEKEGRWLNLVTKIAFLRKDAPPPEPNTHEYPGVIITRRALDSDQALALLRDLIEKKELDTGTRVKNVPLEAYFDSGLDLRMRNRHVWREWMDWPSEIFHMAPTERFRIHAAQYLTHLATPDAPYYPYPELILRDLFGIRSTLNGWPQHLEGAVVLTLPDFRARISKLVIAMGYLKVDLDHPFVSTGDLVLKVYAESVAGRLAQESIDEPGASVQIDLAGKCTRVSVALLYRPTGEVLDEKSFQDGMHWAEEGIELETAASEIDLMLLAGESETLEFKENLSSVSVKEGLAKTAVAFANTQGGTILFGVDDELHVVGCDKPRQLADSVTEILRSHCDLMPTFSTEVVRYEEKDLVLVHVKCSDGPIYTVRDRGPLIRANGSNRSPSALELERMRGGSIGLPPSVGASYPFPWR